MLAGIGAWLPPGLVTNADLANRLDTSDDWIRRRTGIRQRHVAPVGVAASDLAVKAGSRALRSAEVSKVDAVVLTTSTPDRPLPATAPVVAARLGLGTVPAFDVSAVCSGFLYGLFVASGLVAAGNVDQVLLVATEVYSSIVDPLDRSTAVIFGDGAAAVVLRAGVAGEYGALGPVVLGSDGESESLIQIPAGGSRQRTPKVPGDGYFQMAGHEVFRQAVRRMSEVSRQALGAAGWQPADVDRLVAHQANARIIGVLGDELGLPPDRVLSNIETVGNTGSASIPLLLAQAAADGLLTLGQRVLLTAFGGGLAWGATTLTWPGVPAVRPSEHHE
ncbi:beta-ketoacyl-ACP synthase III [Amycolatopsis sp. EV170708-02-1]|uniref:beta-ketoacyl-ACP synthase III n=1 Tax=Amycolatopsis sp. EV170708-02-1 TaxID=2919322 RepID=UPI001F0B962F|nr:beta-ketoacyl-ACP synthase III [Amycolatopsis sp. EV170708-02-1]UMP06847.1 ketoacyl-ACP synthase III [Amycolatopsis sp. EV170708-02-1]